MELKAFLNKLRRSVALSPKADTVLVAVLGRVVSEPNPPPRLPIATWAELARELDADREER